MSISERLCLLLNSLTPSATTREHSEPLKYAQEGYDTAEHGLAQFRPYISLPHSMVLDAGCGLGGKTVYYSEREARHVVGTDFDSAHIRHARHFAKSHSAHGVSFLVSNLSSSPFPPDLFDIIFLNDVVEHIRRPVLEQAFLECHRVLKPGGAICLQFPPWSCYNASHLYQYVSIPWAHLLFSEETLIRVTERYQPESRIGSLSYVEHFRQLNRLELDEFLELVSGCGYDVLHIHSRMIKGYSFLRALPLLRRYLTTRVVAVLTKAKGEV